MLDNLVESQNNTRNHRRGGFMLTTTVLVFSLFASGILWSLFARDLGIGGENLDISSMVAPVITEVEPPKPEPVKEVKQEQSQKSESTEITRKENIANVDEPFVPTEISSKPTTSQARPKNSSFKIGTEDYNPSSSGSTEREGRSGNNTSESTGVKNQVGKIEPESEEPPPVIVKKKEEVKVETKPKTIQISSVLNGKATSLPKPVYSAAAKAVRASGDVSVQVTIDERGNVVSASAINGHALLRQVSEQAARSAKFSPTLLGGQPVKVTGVIVYKFAMQ